MNAIVIIAINNESQNYLVDSNYPEMKAAAIRAISAICIILGIFSILIQVRSQNYLYSIIFRN